MVWEACSAWTGGEGVRAQTTPLVVLAVQYSSSVEDRVMPFPKDTPVLIARTCGCGRTLQYKRDFADVAKLAILRCGDYPG